MKLCTDALKFVTLESIEIGIIYQLVLLYFMLLKHGSTDDKKNGFALLSMISFSEMFFSALLMSERCWVSLLFISIDFIRVSSPGYALADFVLPLYGRKCTMSSLWYKMGNEIKRVRKGSKAAWHHQDTSSGHPELFSFTYQCFGFESYQ